MGEREWVNEIVLFVVVDIWCRWTRRKETSAKDNETPVSASLHCFQCFSAGMCHSLSISLDVFDFFISCSGEKEEQVARERAEAMLSRAEYQYSMENYDSSMGLLEDYAGECQ